MDPKARFLTFAIASGRVGFVLLEGGRVTDLGMSRKASTGPRAVQEFTVQQIEVLRPNVVVTERVTGRSKKGKKTRAIIQAATSVADLADVPNVEVIRGRSHANRFDEAADLVCRYPELGPYLPDVRKPWEAEPKTMIYFEALALVESAFGTSLQIQNDGS